MLTGESLLPVGAAVERVTGQRPHPTTLHRWRLRGVRGIKLETVLCAGRRLTTESAVERFIMSCTRAADGEGALTRTPHQRDRAVQRAEAELDTAGV
jgi:hypothetical protein